MNVIIDQENSSKVAIVKSDSIILHNVQSALDLLATLNHSYECTKVIISMKNIDPSFFMLRTGIAGEILQKYINYGVKLAIIGDFSKFDSQSLQSFIRESNRGNHIFFLHNEKEALEKLHALYV